MKVLVCGGRSYRNEANVCRVLDAMHNDTPISVLIEGGASGADAMAASWAKIRKVNVRTFFARWQEFGKAAGPIRNRRMLDEGKPDVVVAFPGDGGTENMVKQARHAGVRVVEILDDERDGGAV